MKLKSWQKLRSHILLTLVFSLVVTTSSIILTPLHAAEFIVSIRSPESMGDKRDTYTTALIKLILNKTSPTYGPYRLVNIPSMTRPRSIYAAEIQMYPNLILQDNYQDRFSKDGHLTYVEFPTELGMTGHRICFVNPAIKEKIAKVSSIEELKKYSIGQGVGWADSLILQSAGFKVSEIANYDGIFKMVASGRIDLFCRGINELLSEYETFKKLEGLTVDESFLLKYPLPRFFLTNKDNKILINRIREGLQIAYADGSLLELWHNYNDTAISFAKIKQRRVFNLPNPLLGDLSRDYEKYNVNLLQ